MTMKILSEVGFPISGVNGISIDGAGSPGKSGPPSDATGRDGLIEALSGWPAEPVEQNRIFRAALSHMSQGLCMFDFDQRLLLCNDAYASMYGLRPQDSRPGTTLRQILEHRVEIGSSPIGVDDYVESRLRAVSRGSPAWFAVDELRNGRVIAVTHRSLPDGGSVATHEDITTRKRAEDRIAYLAHHDVLTGLANRAYFHAVLDDAIAKLDEGADFSLLYLDLDHFKTVNDTLGHAVGDMLLEQFAQRLTTCLGPQEVAARLGGDEFAILQSGPVAPEVTTDLAERVVAAGRRPFRIDGYELSLSVSVGISLAPLHGTDADQLLRKADIALYHAKWEGRSRLYFFQSHMERRTANNAMNSAGRRFMVGRC